MKKTTLILWITILLLFQPAQNGLAEEFVPKNRYSELSENDINFHKKVKIALKGLNRGIANNNKSIVEKEFRQLEEIRQGLLTEDIPFVAEFLRQRGKNLVLSGQPDFGFLVLTMTRTLFPQHHQTFFTLSFLYLFQSDLDVRNGLSNLVEGVKLYLSFQSRALHASSVVLFFALLVFVYAGYLYLTVHFLRNFRQFFCDLKKHVSFFQNGRLGKVTLLLMVFLPLFLGGFFCFILSVPVFMWRYTEKASERFLFVLSVSIIFLSYPLTLFVANNMSGSEYTYEDKVEEFSHGIWDLETLQLYKKQEVRDENRYYLKTSLALMNSWIGNLRTGNAFFKKLTKEYPDDLSLLLNIGNVRLRMGQEKKAIALYKKAISRNPSRVEPYYNMSLALEGILEFEQANEFYQKAESLNPAQVVRYLEIKNRGKVIPMDIFPVSPELPQRGYLNHEAMVFAKRVWELFLMPDSLLKGGITLAVYLCLIFFVTAFRILPQGKGSEKCPFCGTVVESGAKCILCEALKLSPDRQDPVRREAGVRKVRRYRWFRDTLPVLFNFLMPGAGAVLDENDLTGMMMMLLSVMLIVCFLIGFFFFSMPVFSVAVIIMYVLYSVICNILFIARR